MPAGGATVGGGDVHGKTIEARQPDRDWGLFPDGPDPQPRSEHVGGTLTRSVGIGYANDMDATVLEVLTALLSLVSAVGVLVVNGKVDRLTGRVDSLTRLVDRLTGRVDALEWTLHTVVAAVMDRRPSAGGSA